jgi:hypothetical protein
MDYECKEIPGIYILECTKCEASKILSGRRECVEQLYTFTIFVGIKICSVVPNVVLLLVISLVP